MADQALSKRLGAIRAAQKRILVTVVLAMAATLPSRAQSQTAKTAAQLEELIAQQESTRQWAGGLVSEALTSPDVRVQKLAIRAIGRRQLPNLRDVLLPFLDSPSADIRAETANALGQMNADVDYASYLQKEKTPGGRAVLLETIGRVKTASPKAELVLQRGLFDASPIARVGAARGLEAYVRQRGRNMRMSPELASAVHASFSGNSGQTIRELLLLTMNSAGNQDSTTFAIALRDTSVLVRRLAVMGSKKWVDDKSPIVRYEALRVARDCEHAAPMANDASEMVSLSAIDLLGDRKCNGASLLVFARTGKNWRVRSHALVALAKTQPDSARLLLPTFANDALWHTRVYAATAARVLADSATLLKLARDPQPNVALEAMTTAADAIHALSYNHAGLLFAAANKLKGAPELPSAGQQIENALQNATVLRLASSADARTALQQRLRELKRPYVAPAEPGNIPVERQSDIAKFRGATAQITMQGLGVITLELLYDEAPRTVYQFASLADGGKYNGLTFHRIVPNFVIQGGSPGADEYDGRTDLFMTDEVGMVSNKRGTLGISTRGYDKGDGQIFINLVDNFRLDHAYTVFARVTSGMDIVDRVQEGDVMESVKIIRNK